MCRSRSLLPGTTPNCFFKAEDGIRDSSVTGVQTCALPILLPLTPDPQKVDKLAEQLRFASESADPELLKRRNRQISEDLERYMREAAAQIAEMESVLEKKKRELEASVHQAETDALTGLHNRGAYDLRLREAML